jgi:hypothetical protein
MAVSKGTLGRRQSIIIIISGERNMEGKEGIRRRKLGR